MCEKCVIAVQWIYPELSEEDQMHLLWSATCFPFGGPMQVAKQLIEARDATDGSLEQAQGYADMIMRNAIPVQTRQSTK